MRSQLEICWSRQNCSTVWQTPWQISASQWQPHGAAANTARNCSAPPQAAQALLQAPGSAALVFGREDHGLSTADLSLCTLQATIPSSSEYGSLNLAQAALIFCYELFGAATAETGSLRRTPAPSGELEPLFTHMEQTLLRIGHLNPQNPGHIMRSLRRIFFRSGLDSREVAILRGMLSQIDWAAGDFNDRKKTT